MTVTNLQCYKHITDHQLYPPSSAFYVTVKSGNSWQLLGGDFCFHFHLNLWLLSTMNILFNLKILVGFLFCIAHLSTLNTFYQILHVACTLSSLLNFYWNIVALQCVSFYCRAKWTRYTCNSLLFRSPSPSGHHGTLSRVPVLYRMFH